MSYRFKVFGLKSREFISEVPFTIAGELTRVLQGAGAGELELDVLADGVPAAWAQLILPWRAIILAVDERDEILWNGIPNDDVPVSDVTMSYPCETAEGYFKRRHVPTMSFRREDQANIARALAAVCGDAAGIPLEYDCPATGVLRDEDYADDEDSMVYDRLQELAAAENGFNWTVDVEWANTDHSRIRYVFRTGYPHLGNRTPTPEHVFSRPGNITKYTGGNYWGPGKAATHVRGSGEGTGETRLVSAPVIDDVREATGYVRLEERPQFSSETDPVALAGRVQAAASGLFGGQNALTITVRDGAGTSARDLTMGDSARVTIKAPTRTVDEVQVVVGLSLIPGSEEFRPTLAKLGDDNAK